MFGNNERDKNNISDGGTSRTVPEMMTMVVSAQGNRKYQQDAAYVTPGRILASNKITRTFGIVCDGMGGMTDGGKASQTAITKMKEGFEKIANLPQVNIPEFFREGIVTIDNIIANFPRENGKGSGTTMVACIVEDNRAYWASVGDSRIYIVRGEQMSQVTRDHNYFLRLQEMVKAGEITYNDAVNNKKKEALISFLGIGNVSLMDINATPFSMQYGDVIMLCSDGITKTLPDEQIRMIITDSRVKPEQKARALVDAATHGNTRSQDNTSVVIICFRRQDIKSVRRR